MATTEATEPVNTPSDAIDFKYESGDINTSNKFNGNSNNHQNVSSKSTSEGLAVPLCDSGSISEQIDVDSSCGEVDAVPAPSNMDETDSHVGGETNFASIAKNDGPSTTSNGSVTADDNSPNSDDVSQSHAEMDALSVPKELVEEERKLALETEKEFAEKFSQQRINLDKKEKERRYKTLMSLLGKSNEYAKYMSEKLLREKEKLQLVAAKMNCESAEVLQNSTNKRRSDDALESAIKRPKTSSAEAVEYDAETQYVNSGGLVVSKRQPKLLSGAVMRNYQLDGLEWLVALYKNAVNGILADEMGLGKTIQVISLLCHLREKKIFGPHLIIGPLSTLTNWMFEFANFAPDVPVILFHGNEEKRSEILKQFLRIFRSKDRHQLPIVITSYEIPLRDRNFLSQMKWCFTVVDEGHRLKNHHCQLSIELRKYNTESRLLLTGTPLQNNITELWALLNYLIPEIFDDLVAFESVFDFSELTDAQHYDQFIRKEKEEQMISKMHQILEPFLLRRLKSDVNINLPRKKEILVYAPMTPEQELLYKATLDRSIIAMAGRDHATPMTGKRQCSLKKISYNEDWTDDEDFEYVPEPALQKVQKRSSNDIEYVYNIKLLNPPMMCQKIVNHPYLVKTPVYAGTRDIATSESMIALSGKLLVLDALLPRLKADHHKVLLFSTFTLMLDVIEDYVLIRNYKYVRLDGKCEIDNRLTTIKQFNSDPETFIFLISTRAGGLGINLTAADTVIIYNSDWNPQVDLQAQDRCHRIGQTRPVVVYRLVTAGTIDERIVNCATAKRRLEKLVVKKGKFNQVLRKDQAITVEELRELLESTDYKQVIHPNGFVLSDQQIEQLLDRSDLIDEEKEDVAP